MVATIMLASSSGYFIYPSSFLPLSFRQTSLLHGHEPGSPAEEMRVTQMSANQPPCSSSSSFADRLLSSLKDIEIELGLLLQALSFDKQAIMSNEVLRCFGEKLENGCGTLIKIVLCVSAVMLIAIVPLCISILFSFSIIEIFCNVLVIAGSIISIIAQCCLIYISFSLKPAVNNMIQERRVW